MDWVKRRIEMKKSTKILLFGGLLLTVAGIITMVITGGMLGKQKLKEATANGTLSISEEDIERWIGYFQGGDLPESDEMFVVQRGMVGLGNDVKNLDIRFGAGTFAIQESEDDSIYLQMEHAIPFEYGIDEEGTLYVKPAGDKVIAGAGTITLWLPKNMVFDEVDLELGAGEMKANSLEMKELEVAVAAGQITLNKIKCDEAKLQVGAGEISIERCELNDLSLDLAMGDARLKLEGKEEDYDYDINCGAGEVKVGSMVSAGLAFDRDIDLGKDKKIEVECAMGSVDIEFVQ